jgi:prepilin-type N-terminal cleavage/methylation domain-containing protein
MVTATRGAFTLLELLVVIAIIVVLMGLGVATAQIIRRQTKVAQTQMLLSIVHQALSSNPKSSGTAVHPLAGTKVLDGSRPLFYGSRQGSATATALDASQIALSGPETLVASALKNRLIVPDDRLAEPGAPHLFGLERSNLRILGIETVRTTEVRLIPTNSAIIASDAQTTALESINPKLVDFAFGGSREIELDSRLTDPAATDWERKAGQAVQVILSDDVERLTKLGMLRSPDPDAPLAAKARLRLDTNSSRATTVGTGSSWQQCRILDVDATWKPMLLRGPTLLDSWGTEIVISERDGNFEVRSAGPDGCFVFHPGPNNTLETVNPFEAPASDDRDAAEDNKTAGIQ